MGVQEFFFTHHIFTQEDFVLHINASDKNPRPAKVKHLCNYAKETKLRTNKYDIELYWVFIHGFMSFEIGKVK
jgi:hypothetical protein